MPALLSERYPAPHDTLDIAEKIIAERHWPCDRPEHDELIAEVPAAACNYRLWFTWQEDLEALGLSVAFDGKLPRHAHALVYPLLAAVNEKLWMGHFDLCSTEHFIAYRCTLPLRGVSRASDQQISDMLDVAISECDRFYPAFQSVIWGGRSAEEALASTLFETIGEA